MMDSADAPPDEAAPATQEAAEAVIDGLAYDALATRYETGDTVDTPDGLGVVAEVITETVENDAMKDADGVPDRVDATSDSPVYAVIVEDEAVGVGFYSASDLDAADIETDIDPIESVSEDEDAAAALCKRGRTETAELGEWDPPKSWREADTPARLIALDAWSSMGGKHGGGDTPGKGCVDTMRGKVRNADRFCAGMADYVYGGYTYWRGQSILPGK
jgi:hypothetical protein